MQPRTPLDFVGFEFAGVPVEYNRIDLERSLTFPIGCLRSKDVLWRAYGTVNDVIGS